MSRTIQIITDEEIFERKIKTGLTHETIYVRGLEIFEKEIAKKQDKQKKAA